MVTAQKLQVHHGQQVVQVWIPHIVDCLTTAGILNFKFLGRKFHLRSSESWKQESGQQKVVSEILNACPTPGEKHISEIARKMTKAFPVAFTDVIEGEVVGSGYDSLTKQMLSRVDNLKRGNTSLSLKRQVISSSEGEDTPTQKRRLDTYGCINWQPTWLPPDETPESQKHAQEELKKMWRERCCDSKAIENMMRATFFTQRKDIISGTETSDLTKEWPYLFETTGMKTYFKELTGVDMEDKNIANKCARVISFLKCGDKTEKMETIFREKETSSKNIEV